MEMGEGQRGKEWEETEESAAAWKKRLADWNVRMRLYYQLNREAEWELADAQHALRDAEIEAHEADEGYQQALDWARSSRYNVQEYATVCRAGHERRLSEIHADLEEAREATGGMAWTP